MWVVFAAASMGCGGAAQGRFEAEAYEGVAGEVSADALKTVFRLIRAGSGVERVELRHRLARMGPRVIAPLRNELGSGNHLFACQAALVFAAMRAEETVPSLRAVVEGRLRGDPISAAVALGVLGDVAAVPSLEALRRDGKESRARAAALIALGALGPDAVSRAASEMISGASSVPPASLLTAIGLSGGDRHAALAIRGASTPDDRVRRAAVLALASIGGAEVVRVLLARCGDEDPSVRKHAIFGVAAVGDASAKAALADIGVHKDGDPGVRSRAVAVLVGAGRLRVESALADPHEDVRAAALAGLLFAVEPPSGIPNEAFADRNERVRTAACIVASVTGTPLPKGRIPMLDDTDAGVRLAAVFGAVYRRGVGIVPEMEALRTEKRNDALTALSEEVLAMAALGDRPLRRWAGARLQVMLDDLGVAASWWGPAAIHLAIIETMALENALPEIVAGNVPQGGDRPRSGPRKVAPELEDVRRYLDRRPLPVRRLRTEVPLP